MSETRHPGGGVSIDFDQFANAARLSEAGVARRVDGIAELGQAFREIIGDPWLSVSRRLFPKIVSRYNAEEAVREEIRRAFDPGS